MAGKRECPSCASLIPDDQDRCFICGYEFAGPPARRSWRVWMAVVLLILFLIPIIRYIIHAIEMAGH